MKTLKTVVALLLFCFATVAHAQKPATFAYLPKCYKEAQKDKGTMDIAGIGKVNSVVLAAEGLQSPGLTYFEIPKESQSLKSAKVAKTVADYHKNTWKNNSKLLSNRQYHSGRVSINDLRLHLNEENTDVQILIINEGVMVYELTSFSDNDKNDAFNSLLVKIRQYQCP